MSNTPDQRINVIVGGIIAAGIKEYNKHANLLVASDEYLVDVAKEKAALKSLFETMMAEVVGDTPIPSEDDIWRYTDEGVGKFILLKEQRQRIPQVINKYFNTEEK